MNPLPKPPQKSWYKRSWVWLIIVVLVITGIGWIVQRVQQALTPTTDLTLQTVTAEKRTLTQAVSSTGKITEDGYRTHFIDVLASESEIFNIVTGQKVEITVLAYDNGATTYHGVVESVASKKTTSLSAESGYLIRIRPNDLPDMISRLIDLTVNVKILIDQRDHVLSVERAAIQYDNADAAYVLLADEVRQPVVTGFEGDDYVEIVSGINPGTVVLLNIPKAETASPF